jgi:hypothetical protein
MALPAPRLFLTELGAQTTTPRLFRIYTRFGALFHAQRHLAAVMQLLLAEP